MTAHSPNVVVYVDAAGEVLYTSTAGSGSGASTSATSAPQVASSSASSSAAATSAAATSAAAYSASAYSSAAASSSSAAPAAASSSSSSSSASGLNGIAYSPYSGSVADGNVGCKTAAQVAADFAAIPSSYNLVRIYGTDCNQVENVLTAAKSKGMKVFAGVYDITQVASEIATIIAAANGDWSDFHTISIGNELVNSGGATVAAVVAAIGTARTALSAASYTGNVVTVDTSGAIESNPQLCEASDYVAANAHPFFDSDCVASDAGSWLLSTMQAVSSACGGKDTVITETGWPWAGTANGVAVPSSENQKTAISSIQSTVSSNVIMFTAFNDLWKQPGYLSVEQSWGVYGNSAAS